MQGALTTKCVTMVSMSSSQKGGFASNEPLTGLNVRKGLDTTGTHHYAYMMKARSRVVTRYIAVHMLLFFNSILCSAT